LKLKIVIFLFPFFFIVVVNEFSRIFIPENSETRFKINSSKKNIEKCSWICHNNTNYCKNNHVKFVSNHFSITDKIYFGIIKTLQLTGKYKFANILFLVIVFPLIIYFLLIRNIDLIFKLKNYK